MHSGLGWGNLKKKDNLEDNVVDGIKMDLQVIGCGTWAGLTWFKIYCYKKSTMISGESLCRSSQCSVNIW